MKQCFSFVGSDWQQHGADLQLSLHYRLRTPQTQHAFCERIVFPDVAVPTDTQRLQALTQATRLLHWLAGISYWKTTCCTTLEFDQPPDAWQAQALEQVYGHGLAEFAYVNQLDTSSWHGMFTAAADVDSNPAVPQLRPARRALVPMGGGKDSLVALEMLKAAAVDCTVTAVRPAQLISAVARLTGRPWLPIARHIDMQLLEHNRQGAWNGHVPITAINAAILMLAAILYDFEAVVFANESSADEPSRRLDDGSTVNHQYSKSSAFEALLQDWLARYVATDLYCFSLLRPFTELAICQRFAALEQYHQTFSSCNRQFHLQGARSDSRWCGHCPKCLFVYLALAPFMTRARLSQLFGADLLDDASLIDAYAALCGIGDKPFECVGTLAESRAAMLALAQAQSVDTSWATARVPGRLAPKLREVADSSLSQLLRVEHPHQIPAAYQTLLSA